MKNNENNIITSHFSFNEINKEKINNIINNKDIKIYNLIYDYKIFTKTLIIYFYFDSVVKEDFLNSSYKGNFIKMINQILK